MKRLTEEEVKNLTDKEVKLAFERIERDYSFGLLNDEVTPLENTQLLEEELRKREGPAGN